MIAIETDIMALVERIAYTREALQRAQEANKSALDALRAAEKITDDALTDFQVAQNSLVVAAGGTDMSFIWNLPRP